MHACCLIFAAECRVGDTPTSYYIAQFFFYLEDISAICGEIDAMLWIVFQSESPDSLFSATPANSANRQSLSPITFSSRSGRPVMEFETTLIPALLPITLFHSGADFVTVS